MKNKFCKEKIKQNHKLQEKYLNKKNIKTKILN